MCYTGAETHWNAQNINKCYYFFFCIGSLQTNSVHTATCCNWLCTCPSRLSNVKANQAQAWDEAIVPNVKTALFLKFDLGNIDMYHSTVYNEKNVFRFL